MEGEGVTEGGAGGFGHVAMAYKVLRTTPHLQLLHIMVRNPTLCTFPDSWRECKPNVRAKSVFCNDAGCGGVGPRSNNMSHPRECCGRSGPWFRFETCV